MCSPAATSGSRDIEGKKDLQIAYDLGASIG